MSADPAETIRLLSRFAGANLTDTLARIEGEVRGVTSDRASAFLDEVGAERAVLAAAGEMKRLAGQINVTIHALGILLCLPHILEEGEWVEYVSLGAGNAGRQFDLETSTRVAEFKFINWRGGAESIRQNLIFKDYFLLAEAPTPKRKYLYLLGTQHALKFLNGGRAISSVLSRGDKVQNSYSTNASAIDTPRLATIFKPISMKSRLSTCPIGCVSFRTWRGRKRPRRRKYSGGRSVPRLAKLRRGFAQTFVPEVHGCG